LWGVALGANFHRVALLAQGASFALLYHTSCQIGSLATYETCPHITERTLSDHTFTRSSSANDRVVASKEAAAKFMWTVAVDCDRPHKFGGGFFASGRSANRENFSYKVSR
jgi:hypothetical protein